LIFIFVLSAVSAKVR